jgi:acyl phosphate:glycerol-3-phosphate acyltransferase
VAVPPVGVLVVALVVGAVPFSNLMARTVADVDLRRWGSGTVSGTGLYRVAGFAPLVVAGILDVAKGALGPALAGADRPVLAAVAAGLAVAGHNWSLFLRGAGGRGVSVTLGALGVIVWPGAVLLLVAMMTGRAFGQTGLGTFVGLLTLVPVCALAAGASGALAAAGVLVPMLLKRALGDQPSRGDGGRAHLVRMVFDRPVEPRPTGEGK